ncbi:MAG: GNAT family N-acetyltransferase [Candidatus Thorarchaeota archaeon]|nr:GNAT family N-acetyltransferase [Candidatus Thorarchaeota archaeon]
MVDFTVRRVVESDRDDVLEIARRTWGGHDYMPSQLDEWLKSPSCRLVGLEVAGRIIGLANLHMIDSGRTGWMEGLRVHPRYRRKGLAKVLTDELVKEGRNAGVERLRYTTDSTNSASISLAKSIGMSVRAEMGVFWKGGLKRVKKGGVKESPQYAERDAAERILKGAAHLFSDGVIIHDWKAYDFCSEGISQVLQSARAYILTDNERIGSVTFGSVRTEGQDSGWSTAIYAETPSDFTRALYSQVFLARAEGRPFLMGIYPLRFRHILLAERWVPKWVERFSILLFEKRLG